MNIVEIFAQRQFKTCLHGEICMIRFVCTICAEFKAITPESVDSKGAVCYKLHCLNQSLQDMLQVLTQIHNIGVIYSYFGYSIIPLLPCGDDIKHTTV